jgi:hypothetical protein
MTVGIFKAFEPSIVNSLLITLTKLKNKRRTRGGFRVIAPAAAQEQEQQQP